MNVVLFKALSNFDGDSNGGRESYTQVVDDTLYNVFPRVVYSDRELVSNYLRYRKVFVHNIDSNQYTFNNARIWIDKLSPGDDYFSLNLGDASNIQSDIVGISNWGFTGHLNSEVSAGATSIEVEFFHNDFVVDLASGDKLYITNLKDMSDTTHHSEFNEIDSITHSQTLATITLVNSLTYDYPVSYDEGGITYYTRVAKYKEIGDLKAHTDTVVATTAGDGDFNEVTYPITGNNTGSVRDSITLTFTSSASYTANGSYIGNLGTGTTTSDFSPNNPNTSTPYFTIPYLGWTGTWASGDTLTFELYSSSQAIWIREYISPSITSMPDNDLIIGIYGESI